MMVQLPPHLLHGGASACWADQLQKTFDQDAVRVMLWRLFEAASLGASINEVAHQKSRLARGLGPDRLAVLNRAEDSVLVSGAAAGISVKSTAYETRESAGVFFVMGTEEVSVKR